VHSMYKIKELYLSEFVFYLWAWATILKNMLTYIPKHETGH